MHLHKVLGLHPVSFSELVSSKGSKPKRLYHFLSRIVYGSCSTAGSRKQYWLILSITVLPMHMPPSTGLSWPLQPTNITQHTPHRCSN